MTEVTKEAYAKEYFYLQTLHQQAVDFEELLKRFPEDDVELREILQKANAQAAARNPSFILNPELVVEIKAVKPEIFKRFAPIYQSFLAEKAGLK